MLAIDRDGHSATSTNETYLRLQRLRSTGYFDISTHIYLIWGFAFFLRIVLQLHVDLVNGVDLRASLQNSSSFNSASCMIANACRGLEDMHGLHNISSFR